MNDNFELDEEDLENETEDSSVCNYDISISPNDFNVSTIFNFVEKKFIRIPNFQRNYVWDIKKASRLIESLLLGLPIPQIFLFQEDNTSQYFLVIDGQQRLMSLYYFIKKRFPKLNKRVELSRIFREKGEIPDEILSDDNYFSNFNLNISNNSLFDKKNYDTLGEYKNILDLKTIRNIVIKQNSPSDNRSMFEIFNRLNSGGENLRSQEIRDSLYHSKFYELLYELNLDSRWRTLLPNSEPDLHMRDIEILLRGFSMLIFEKDYRPSMVMFLNESSFKAKQFNDEKIMFLKDIFLNFIDAILALGDSKIFFSEQNKFNISIFEAIFCALCKEAYENSDSSKIKKTRLENINNLKYNEDFKNAFSKGTTSIANVKYRIEKARDLL